MQGEDDTTLSSIISSLAEKVCELEDLSRSLKHGVSLLQKLLQKQNKPRRKRRPLTKNISKEKVWKPDSAKWKTRVEISTFQAANKVL